MHRIAGFTLPANGPPRQEVSGAAMPTRVGLLGSDYRGLRLRPLVAEGDRVRAGDPVLADRTRPELVVTAPLAGTVEVISIGERRQVGTLEIRVESDERREFDIGGGTKEAMLASGLWTALRRRPFGGVPVPDEAPTAILVSAMSTEPGAADPAVCIARSRAAFDRGAAALGLLTDGPVLICQGAGDRLAGTSGRIRSVVFRGGHPAGLPGIQIERLCPASAARPVWDIGHEDVIALGTLLSDGHLPIRRIVALGGDRARAPRLIELPGGADLEELALNEAAEGPRRVLSGSALSGRESRFLRRRDAQVSLLERPAQVPPKRPRFGVAPKRAALIPHAALIAALGPDIPAIPLLRSLSVGDNAAAARLGALGLVEEDMALATYLTGGTEDFGARLRAVLDRLEAGA